MLQELTGLSSTTRLKVKKWRKSNFSIGKLLLKSVNVFIQFHSYTALLHNYLSIIKCEMFRNIAHSDIYMKLHSFGVWTTKHSNSRNISGNSNDNQKKGFGPRSGHIFIQIDDLDRFTLINCKLKEMFALPILVNSQNRNISW